MRVPIIFWLILLLNILKTLSTLKTEGKVTVNAELGLVTNIDNDPDIYFIQDIKTVEWSLFFRNPTTMFDKNLIKQAARCDVGRNTDQRYLNPLLQKINSTWNNEIDDLTNIIPNINKSNHRHKKSILLGLGLLAAMLLGYLAKSGVSKFFHLDHTHDKETVMKLTDRTIRLGSYVTKDRQQLAALGNSLCFYLHNKDDWLREREVNHHLSTYVKTMEELTLDLSSGKLPPNRKVVADLKKACLEFQQVNNDLAERFCTHVLSSRPEIEFLGFIVGPGGILQLDVLIRMPIVSAEMQNLQFSVLATQNIGFYSKGEKVRLNVPEYSMLFEKSHQLVEIELSRCRQKICPISSIKSTPPSMCLADIFGNNTHSNNCINTIINDEYCESILIPSVGTLISVRNAQFVTSGIEISTQTLVNANTIVQRGRLICSSPITNFSLAIDGKDNNNHRQLEYTVSQPLNWEFGQTQTFFHKLNKSINSLKLNEFEILDMPITHQNHFTVTSALIFSNFFFLIFFLHLFRAKLLGAFLKIRTLFSKPKNNEIENDLEMELVGPENGEKINLYPTLQLSTQQTQYPEKC